ncbi:MAG: hypothetical protein JXA57_17470, partial [Armatimonadetes bacterium]|nr:hypothetical protein [Armatimonadota bacterium]
VPRAVLTGIRRLSREYHESDPIDYVTCCVVENREDARHWIELRHTGENGGVGVVSWNSDEAQRFRTRGSMPPPHIQALDFLQKRGDLTPEVRHGFPTSSLQRLVGSRAVQDKLGIEIRGGQLMLRAGENAVAKALLHVVNQLASGKVRTVDIYTAEDREKYANNLPSGVAVAPTLGRGQGVPVGSPSAATRKKKSSKARIARRRAKLIPRDCVMNVTDTRCQQIETELRRLALEDFPNAVSVLFRVFIELSTDDYIDRFLPSLASKLSSKNDRTSLSTKLQEVARSLVSRKKLTNNQAVPVRRAATKNSFLAPSSTLMNQYVHNKHVFPAPSDLRADWDSLQPFFIAIWGP